MEIKYRKIDRFWNDGGNVKDLFNVSLSNQDMVLTIGCVGTGDLFMMVSGGEQKRSERDKYEKTFLVPKVDEVYPLFLNLYQSVVDAEIPTNKPTSERESELNEKFKLRLKHSYSYRNIFNRRGEIVWQSDDEPWNLARRMTVTSGTDGIRLSFESREPFVQVIRSSDRDHCVFVSNSGSRYEPFNLCFVQLYRQLQPSMLKLSEDEEVNE